MATTPLWASTGTVVSPQLFAPHATIEPSRFKATVSYVPAAIATTPLCASTGTVARPAPGGESSPHATTAPSLVNATLWPAPAAIAVNRVPGSTYERAHLRQLTTVPEG